MSTKRTCIAVASAIIAAAAALATATGAGAQGGAAVAITVKDHRFQPAQPHAPANRPLTITVKNLDAAAMEFESVSMRVEKVIPAGGQGSVHVRPLAPGRYEFFDDFHSATTGTLVVE
jgi:hypothetical protein